MPFLGNNFLENPMKTPKTDFLIMEINAMQILEAYGTKNQSTIFSLDFNDKAKRKFYLNTIDFYDSNALIDQINFLYDTDSFSGLKQNRYYNIPKNKCQANIETQSLDTSIVIMDFTGVFSKSFGKRDATGNYIDEKDQKRADKYFESCNNLFSKGIQIIYGETVVSYIPFDKSNSMARHDKISFINKGLYDALNQRLLFDIDFHNSGYKEHLSKFFAYKGLYMSSANRIEHPELILDENSFIVIKDTSFKVLDKEGSRNLSIYGESKNRSVDESASPYCEELRTSYLIGKVFDGEGIISSSYSGYINESLKEFLPNKDSASSFQIRMPFVKGMLHEVELETFFKDIYSASEGYSDDSPIYIKDYFGKKRNLRNAKVIIPSSMFKWASWLKDLFTKEEVNKGSGIDPAKYDKDPMLYYFDKFKAYHHALYISNVNTILGKHSRTTLNYQYLNTLKLSSDKLKTLLDAHMENVKYPIHYLKNTYASGTEISDIDEEGNKEFTKLSPSLSAVLHNPIFQHQTKVNSDLRAISNSLVVDAARGRIQVEGEVCFLSRDLLRYLTDLIYLNISYLNEEVNDQVNISKENTDKDNTDKENTDKENTNKESRDKDNTDENNKNKVNINDNLTDASINKMRNKIKSIELKTKAIQKKALFHTRFYMPGNHINLSKNQICAIFRSPHLSRNEQCALKAYTEDNKNNYYLKYFPKLTNIIMLSYDSLDPFALGGADFDGDIVKVISNDIVAKAVLDGAYKENDNHNYIRKIPIIEIPDKTGANLKLNIPNTIEESYYATVKNTFSSRVGQISNAAIRIGQVQYSYENDDSENAAALKYKCQDCTILTGLEIDAAKSGIHPDLTDLLKYCQSKDKGAKAKKAQTNKNDNSNNSNDYSQSLSLSYDYIQNFKSQLDVLRNDKKFHFKKTPDEMLQSKNYELIRRPKKDTTPFIAFDGNYEANNLALLPTYFFENISIYSPKTVKNEAYFTFMAKEILKENNEDINEKIDEEVNEENSIIFDKNWAKDIDFDMRKQIATIVYAYQEVLKLNQKVSRFIKFKKDTNYDSFAYNILKIQYDDEKAKYFFNDIILPAYHLIENHILSKANEDNNTINAISETINKIKNQQWGFLLDQQKDKALRDIFEIEDNNDEDKEFCENLGISYTDVYSFSSSPDLSFAMLVKNFYAQGYNLLYFILKDIDALHAEYSDESELNEFYKDKNLAYKEKMKVEKVNKNMIDFETFKSYYQDFYQNFNDNYLLPAGTRKEELFKACKAKIDECFDDVSIEDKIKTMYSLNKFFYKYEKMNKNGKKSYLEHVDAYTNFFWNYFTAEELHPFINPENKAEGTQNA